MIVVQPKPPACGECNADEELSLRLQAALRDQPWYPHSSAQLFVVDGVVTVEGLIASEALGRALCATVQSVAGPDKVQDSLIRVNALAGATLAFG